MLLEFLLQSLEAVAVFIDGADLCLQNDVLRRGRTNDLREPSAVSRAPIGPATVTDIVSEPKGCETKLGSFAIADGIFTRPRKVANGFIVDRGDIHRGESARARRSGEWHSIAAVGLDASPRLCGEQRGGDHPAVVALFAQIPLEPGATRTGRRDDEQMFGLGMHLTDELINVTWTGAKAAEGGDLGAMILSDIGDRNRVLVNIHSDKECARLRHG